MRIGYARVSKADGSQSLDLQRDALQAAGVDVGHVCHDFASGVRDDRPGLDSCGRALRTGDILVIWKIDRLGRTLVHLVNTVQDLFRRTTGATRRTRSPLAGREELVRAGEDQVRRIGESRYRRHPGWS